VNLSLSLFSVFALSIPLVACGGARSGRGTATHASSSTSQTAAAVAPAVNTTKTAPSTTTTERRHLRGDEDDDERRGETSSDNRHDNDADFDNDVNDARLGYIDRDDRAVLRFGHKPTLAVERTLRAFAERYYAAAAAGDGATACALIAPEIVKTIPASYGEGSGPAYMRGKTCVAVISGLFRHLHTQMAAGFVVTGARVNGDQALVFIGSKGFPAAYLLLERRHNGWRLMGMVSLPLP
jgi:hypothetical protein